MRRFKIFLLLLLFVFFIAAGIKVVQMRKQELDSAKVPEKPVMSVSTARAEKDGLLVVRSYRGEISPERTTRLSPRIQGRIEKINGRAGDGFGPETILVRLDSKETREKLQALKAGKEKIKHRIWFLQRTLERQKELVGGAVSREQYERTVSDLSQARADMKRIEHELEEVRTRIGYSTLNAGFPGRIQTRLQEPGDMAQPGKGILLLEDKSAGYNVRVGVPPEVQAGLNPGQKITLRSGEGSLQSEITRIYPAAVPPSPLIRIEVHLGKPPFGLPSGASVEARLHQEELQGVTVPARAVLEQEEGAFVFCVNEDSRIQAVPVTIRARNPDRVLIRGEIQSGDEVAIGPRSLLMRLSPGILVRRAAKGDS